MPIWNRGQQMDVELWQHVSADPHVARQRRVGDTTPRRDAADTRQVNDADAGAARSEKLRELAKRIQMFAGCNWYVQHVGEAGHSHHVLMVDRILQPMDSGI